MSPQIEMQVRHAPSRPYRLGTQRRQPRRERSEPLQGCASAQGASRSRAARPDSLDTEKHLATTVAKWVQAQETPQDTYKKRYALWRKLCETVYAIWQDYAAAAKALPRDGAEWKWWAAYEEEKAKVLADESPEFDAWLDSFKKRRAGREFPSYSDAFAHLQRDWRDGLVGQNATAMQWKYLDEWKRKNRPIGVCAKVLSWEKQYFQLYHCQGQWIGYQASCCAERTAMIAVPIGCNHRLCPLCNWQRSENAQRKARQIFDRFEHPLFITLTASNTKRITKRTFNCFRKRVRQWLAENDAKRGGLFRGGVYAIETTYSRAENSWHVHAHVLADAVRTLPKKNEGAGCLAGRRMMAFTRLKMELEFCWSRLWIKGLGKATRANASKISLEAERGDFEFWARGCAENRTREFRGGEWRDIDWLPEAELDRRRAWNRANRRVLDIRGVDDRVKAVKEVLKYITKSSDFIRLKECVIAFYEATRGARLIQTWGSCYGIDLTVEFDTSHPEDWSHMECTCGSNHWERFGVLYRRDVAMDASGRWRPRPELTHNPRGTVPRPTIRALDAPEERNGDQPWRAI